MKQLENKTPYLWLKWVTTLMAIAYTLMFFGRLISNRATLHASGLDGDFAVPGSPQAMIALCFVMLVLALWFLRGAGKIGTTIFLYLALLGFFAYWFKLTNEIKSSIGSSISRTSGLDRVWIGSTLLEPLAFVVAVVMFALAILILLKTRAGDSKATKGIGHGSGLSGTHTRI